MALPGVASAISAFSRRGSARSAGPKRAKEATVARARARAPAPVAASAAAVAPAPSPTASPTKTSAPATARSRSAAGSVKLSARAQKVKRRIADQRCHRQLERDDRQRKLRRSPRIKAAAAAAMKREAPSKKLKARDLAARDQGQASPQQLSAARVAGDLHAFTASAMRAARVHGMMVMVAYHPQMEK